MGLPSRQVGMAALHRKELAGRKRMQDRQLGRACKKECWEGILAARQVVT